MAKPRAGAAIVVKTTLCLGFGLGLAVTACGNQGSSSTTGRAGTVTSPMTRRPLVSVYVARTDIAKGTSGDTASATGQLELAKIPAQFKPTSAITDPRQLSGKLALFDIPAHSVLVADMFAAPPMATGSP